MYTRQESSLIRKKFWTLFGQYLRPLKNADGETVNWINYKTGIRNIFFRMDADQQAASISIEIREPDPVLRIEKFSQLSAFRQLLENETGEKWNWEPLVQDENGQIISRVSKDLSGVNVFNEADWPSIISFLKQRIIALDAFWVQIKPSFE